MRNRAFRPFAMMLSILLLASVSVQASPVNFGEVVSVLGGLQNASRVDRLRLRAVTQDPSTPSSPGGVTNNLTASSASSVNVTDVDGSSSAQPSLIAGTEVASQGQQQVNVEVFEQDTVDGTICDCGEIPSAGGGFSKWWLLALVPLVCVTGICHHEEEERPTPTPTPPPIPEPATLLLLGSGLAALGAGARRRYAKARGKSEAATTEEV